MKTLLHAILGLAWLFTPWITQAQRIEVDWSKDDASISCPAATAHQKRLLVLVRNINDILYSYSVETSSTPVPDDDFGQLSKGGQGIKAFAANSACPIHDKVASLLSKLTGPELSPTNGTKASSVKLSQTLKAWEEARSLRSQIDPERDNPQCTAEINLLKQVDLLMSRFAARVQSSKKEWSGDVALTVGATNRVSVTISEKYGSNPDTPGGEIVTRGPVTKQCDIPSSVLTLSAGTLFSTIGARDYTVVRTPTPDATGTYNALVVQDANNLRPLVVGMLNYDLPIWSGWNNGIGLQISSGPTFRIGGPSNVSSFGYFAGVSANLWKRFFITPGIHFGEFADFPLGFGTHSVVPDGFAQLTPVKRWTAKFGLSLTYQAKSLSALGTKETSPTMTKPENKNP